MAQSKKQPAGARPKRVPQRTCVACKRTDAKRGLMRLVRSADGAVTLDASGKSAGRGAYLCHDPACWEQALKRRGLERALRLESLRPDDRRTLEQIAHDLGTVQESA